MKKQLRFFSIILLLAGMMGCAKYSADNPLDPNNVISFTVTQNFNAYMGAFPLVFFGANGWTLNTSPSVSLMVNNVPGSAIDNTPYLDFETSPTAGSSLTYYNLSGQDLNAQGKLDVEFDIRTATPAMQPQGSLFCIIGNNSGFPPQGLAGAGFGIQYSSAFQQGHFAYTTGNSIFQSIGGPLPDVTWNHVKIFLDFQAKTMSVWVLQTGTGNSTDWNLIVKQTPINNVSSQNCSVQFRGTADIPGGSSTLGYIDNIKIGNAP